MRVLQIKSRRLLKVVAVVCTVVPLLYLIISHALGKNVYDSKSWIPERNPLKRVAKVKMLICKVISF